MAKEYWAERQARAQAAITEKGIAEMEKQLIKYYKGTMRRVIGQFEKTYDKLLLTISDGRAPTPADLYKLNTYWEMQGQLQKELQKLGDKQAALFSKQFMDEWQNIYQSIAIKDDVFFSEIDRKAAEQMINQIWCADGQTWSNRIWKNTQRLQQALNDNLIDCVVAGKRTTDLKNLLQEQFGVSYNRADSIVRTEMAHIQTQAAKQRYKDAGVTEVEVWADKDERRCEVCGKLHQKRFPANGAMPIPAHPRCRCCIIPVIDTEVKADSAPVAEQPKVEKRERRRMKTELPQFENMSRKELEEWSKANLKTNINYKGATDEVARIVAENMRKLEEKGIDLQDIRIDFRGTKGNYGAYVSKDRAIHLRPNANFIERMIQEDNLALYKLKKPQHAVSSYKGMLNHEIGHALDELSGYELSKAIGGDRLYSKAVKISNYAGTSAAYGAPRGSEAIAENISAFLDGGEKLMAVDEEIRKLIEEQLRKLKRR